MSQRIVALVASTIPLLVACRSEPDGGKKDTSPQRDTSDTGEAMPPRECEDLPWTSIDVGMTVGCGIHTDGCLECWGTEGLPEAEDYDRGYGESCRDVDYGDADPPNLLFKSVSVSDGYSDGSYYCGSWHTCGLDLDGGAHCWGRNHYGQADAPAGTFAQISAGAFHSCALTEDGLAVCWGDTGDVPDERYSMLEISRSQTYAVRDDGAIVGFGAMGVVDDTREWKEVGADQYLVCGLDVSGRVFGIKGLELSGIPREDPFQPIIKLGVGTNNACGLHEDGSIECWTRDSDDEPFEVPVGVYVSFSVDTFGVCAVDAAGYAGCWATWEALENHAIPGTWVLPG